MWVSDLCESDSEKEGGATAYEGHHRCEGVKKAATPAPNSKPELVSREDISLKVKLPDEVRQGCISSVIKKWGNQRSQHSIY